MAVRETGAALLAILACACAAAPPADPAPLAQEAARVREVAEAEGRRLRAAVLALLDPAAIATTEAEVLLAEAERAWQACASDWRALEDHGARLTPLLQALAFDRRGALPAADSWRRMALELRAAPEATDAAARAMARERHAVAALQAARDATFALAQSFDARRQDSAVALLATGERLESRLLESEEGRERRRESLTLLVERAESVARMEAAGAGRADPAELRHLAEDRAELARVVASLAASAATREAVRDAFTHSAERMRRTGFAAQDWAAAHAEIADALAEGRRPEHRGLRAAAALAAQ